MTEDKSKMSLEKLTLLMVHDVRTPITIINMLSYTWEQKFKDDKDLLNDLQMLKDEIEKVDAIATQYREDIRKFFKE